MNASLLNCSPTFLNHLSIPSLSILSLTATLIINRTLIVPIGFYANHGGATLTSTNICNITVSYTHPGENDHITVHIWLPQENPSWNGRLQAVGGSGWQAGPPGSFSSMAGAVSEGYATLSTDAGVPNSPLEWGLLSPGNINLYLLRDLGSVSLNDASLIGKALIKQYYGMPPKYSYFSGVSQGGRQGLMLAQRYPDAYDGIAASAPAINFAELFVSPLWAVVLMNEAGYCPRNCEFQAITAGAIKACDGLDGVVDSVISDQKACARNFHARQLIGSDFFCADTGKNQTISKQAVAIAKGIWDGPQRADGSSFWGGFSFDAVLATEDVTSAGAPATTTCSLDGKCVPVALGLLTATLQIFIFKNQTAELDLSNVTRAEFLFYYHAARQQFEGIIDTTDPDLSAFRARGGKMVAYHGLADSTITPFSSSHYYDEVTAIDSKVHDFYRLFFAPGLIHTFGGVGAYPDGTFDALRRWVEEGIVPVSLDATSVGMTPEIKRKLCPYPKVQVRKGVGNATAGQGFACQ